MLSGSFAYQEQTYQRDNSTTTSPPDLRKICQFREMRLPHCFVPGVYINTVMAITVWIIAKSLLSTCFCDSCGIGLYAQLRVWNQEGIYRIALANNFSFESKLLRMINVLQGNYKNSISTRCERDKQTVLCLALNSMLSSIAYRLHCFQHVCCLTCICICFIYN